jgi:cell division protein FtsZ
VIEYDVESVTYAKMKVIGVGGAGGNAVNRMVEAGLLGVRSVSINTDGQALDHSKADETVQIGKKLTKGLGAGADPEIGRLAAEEDLGCLKKAVSDADMVFVTCGMGGGTGTGAIPIVSRCAREAGALTVGIVTKPFLFEGRQRINKAVEGIKRLRENVDTLILIPNQRLLKILDPGTSLAESFRKADEVLYSATKGIADLITRHGLINLDFADVRTIMSEKGDALMGTGFGCGDNGAALAAKMAISSPLLEDIDISGARGVLVNITGSKKMTIMQVSDAMEAVYAAVGGDANIIFGAVIDNNLVDEIFVTVIATGFGKKDDFLKKQAVPASLFKGENGGLHPPVPRKKKLPADNHHVYQEIMNNGYSPDNLEKPAFERYPRSNETEDDDGWEQDNLI